MMKESESNDINVVSEYSEIFEAEELSQEEIKKCWKYSLSTWRSIGYNTILVSQMKGDSTPDK